MKKLLLLLLLCSPLQAAVTWDATSSSPTTNTSATTVTWNHTIGSGCTNALLWVSVSTEDDTFEAATSVTFGGAALTSQAYDEQNGLVYSAWYKKETLTKGSAVAILVTFPFAKNQILGISRSFCGVDQTTTFGTVATAEGGSSPATVTVTSATGELVIDMAMSSGGATSFTVGAGQTQSTVILGAGANHYNGVSQETGASSVTMSWTQGVDHYWGMIGVSLKPAAASSPVAPILLSQRRRRQQ